jgi:hypothetical protein
MASEKHAPNDRDLKPSSARKDNKNEKKKKDDMDKGDNGNPLAPPVNVEPGS